MHTQRALAGQQGTLTYSVSGSDETFREPVARYTLFFRLLVVLSLAPIAGARACLSFGFQWLFPA